MSELCPNCSTEIRQGTRLCPNCEHSPAPPSEDKTIQEQPQSQETPEPEQEQPPLPDFEKTEQQVDPAPERPSSEIRALLKGLLPAVYTMGGILGVVMVLLVGAALPITVVLISAAELLLKIIWLLAVGAVFATIVVFFRAKTSTNVDRSIGAFDTQHEQLPVQGAQDQRQAESLKTGESSSHDEEHVAPDTSWDYQANPPPDEEGQDAEKPRD